MSRFASLGRELGLKIQQQGLCVTLKLGTAKVIREARKLATGNSAAPHPFDLKYGTDTSAVVEVGALDMPDERAAHAVRYQTAIVEVFESILAELKIAHKDFVFIDIGSGKGRAMLLASKYPWKAIRGIELSSNLHETACRNISIYKEPEQRCLDVRSICTDACSFEFPAESLVLYLFNPFDESVMLPFVSNLARSLKAWPRQAFVCYLKPVHRKVFESSGLFDIFKQTDRYVIFRGK